MHKRGFRRSADLDVTRVVDHKPTTLVRCYRVCDGASRLPKRFTAKAHSIDSVHPRRLRQTRGVIDIDNTPGLFWRTYLRFNVFEPTRATSTLGFNTCTFDDWAPTLEVNNSLGCHSWNHRNEVKRGDHLRKSKLPECRQIRVHKNQSKAAAARCRRSRTPDHAGVFGTSTQNISSQPERSASRKLA